MASPPDDEAPEEAYPSPEAALAYADGSTLSDNAAEADAFAAHIAAGAGIPHNVAALRAWVRENAT